MIRRLTVTVVFFFTVGTVNAVDVSEAVTIGGIRQWINIKGLAENAPVLLFLHGGPGNSALPYSEQFTTELQTKFVVVQWDQRETGMTKKLNASPVPLTVALFESDVVSMINYLRSRFGKDKIYLMGHSWGGFLGMSTAAKHPELLEAFFAISPMIWQEESERQTLALMKEAATRENNSVELRELSSVHIPFASGSDLYYHRKWLSKLMKQKAVSRAFVEGWAVKWLAVFKEASAVNFFSEAPEIRCPVYFLLGAHDYQTYFKIAEDYFNKVKAPKKQIFWFPDSAHTFFSAQRKKLQEIVIQQLPEASN